MAISVDWPTKVITVPKADTTLIQSSPTEIRELDLNSFRLTLRSLEDDYEGMPFPRTHSHNTEVDVGGLTLARVIQIVNGYTITFEDGQYAVNLTGANSNVGDNVNVNQVSVRSFNSAGLISSPAIEYASFNGGVTIDVTNGVSGTTYNKGTPENPVDNVADALLIAEFRGFDTLKIIGDITFTTGDDVSDYIIEGQSKLHTTITVETGADVEGCIFRNCTLTGVLDGNNIVEDSRVNNINYLNGYIRDCLIQPGTITLGGSTDAHFLDCWTEINGSIPIIDMGGSGQDLNLSGYKGSIQINNLTGASNKAVINLDSGEVVVDSTVTNGDITLRGVGTYEHTQTGSETINVDGLVNKETIAVAVSESYNDKVYYDGSSSYSGTAAPNGTSKYPVNNLADALTIASREGIDHIDVAGTLTVTSSHDISGYTLEADRSPKSTITVESGATTEQTYFENVTVSGVMNGIVRYTTSVLGAITNFAGGAKNCLLTGDITITGSGANYFTDCDTYVTDSSAYKTLTISDKLVNIIRCRGNYCIKGKTSTGTTSVDLVAGRVKIDSDCTAGSIYIDGIGEITDNSAVGCTVTKQIVNGATVKQNNTLIKAQL